MSSTNVTNELKEKFHQFVLTLQDDITHAMRLEDPGLKLCEDLWQKKDALGNEGGGGRTRAFNGLVFENAGVNTSLVYGAIEESFAKNFSEKGIQFSQRSDVTATSTGGGPSMWACGISLIIHPLNPKVPTVHANFRMIEMGNKIWFGGGADLTPYYPIEEDFRFFHGVWKKACSPLGENVYEKMKNECDSYFVNHHRDEEMRGVGGLFFDYHSTPNNPAADYDMVTHLASHFIESYFPIVKLRKNESYNDDDVDFQLHRRGRYVEFNLLHDRGTQFGLKSKGRTDSILISLPHRAKFSYRYSPKLNSPHEKMMSYYFPQTWA